MIKELYDLGFSYEPEMEMYIRPQSCAWVQFSVTGGEFGYYFDEDGQTFYNVIKFTVNQLPNVISSVKQALSI